MTIGASNGTARDKEPTTRMLGGFRILSTRTDALTTLLSHRLASRVPTELLFANTNFVMKCRTMVDVLHGPETIIVNDGIGLDLASRMLHGEPFPENLNGTDFVPRLLASIDGPVRLFLIGARPDVVRAAAVYWSASPHVTVVGAVDGYEGLADVAAVHDALIRATPDILLVALGDPLQARWIVDQRGRHAVPLVIGVGALFDFVSGHAVRAPAWVRSMRLEFLHRLVQEPRRLLKRYSIDLVAFFAHCRTTHRSASPPAARADEATRP